MTFFKPVSGPHSTVDDLSQRLLRRWVPKWYGAFASKGSALFYERLGRGFKPVSTGRYRLLSQLRQLAMYSHAATRPERFMFTPDLKRHFGAIAKIYAGGESGAWVFALDEGGAVIDATRDLYTHAFVLFAFGLYGRATGDVAAHEHAKATALYIDKAFRAGVTKGFTEALDGTGTPVQGLTRRHESHMHLLEGCLFAASVWGDAIFMALADEIVALFFSDFYDAQTNTLSEYFTNDLKPAPDPARGCITCEAGHYYEWIWLLKKYAAAKGDPVRYDAACLNLLDWANRFGWDTTYGGIYDELDAQGRVVVETKRLWPFTEGLKANALMLGLVPDRDAAKDHMAAMTRLFRDKYMDERGFWTEWLNRDLTPAVDYMPATTPYHVYFGITEAQDILKRRGASKSWRAGPRRLAYAFKRAMSTLVQAARGRLA